LVVKDILGVQEIDYSKVQQLTADAKFDIADIKASIAVLNFILTCATKHGVDDESLSCEIQQLGLPKEHTSALCKNYAENYQQFRIKLKNSSLRLNQIDGIRWRVDYILGSSQIKSINEPTVELCFDVKSGDEKQPIAFSITPNKLRVLLSGKQNILSSDNDIFLCSYCINIIYKIFYRVQTNATSYENVRRLSFVVKLKSKNISVIESSCDKPKDFLSQLSCERSTLITKYF